MQIAYTHAGVLCVLHTVHTSCYVNHRPKFVVHIFSLFARTYITMGVISFFLNTENNKV